MNIVTSSYQPFVSKVKWGGRPDGPGVLCYDDDIPLLRFNCGTGCLPRREPCNGALLVMGLQE